MELIIDIGITQNRALLFNEEGPYMLYVENKNNINITGNIYKGIVENVVASLNCAFIDIGEEKRGILHFKDCLEKTIKKGDEVLVQVIREGVGSKGPRLSMDISIPGKNIVILINSKEVNISRKIKNKNRKKELNVIGERILNEKNLGTIFRTECENIEDSFIYEEYEKLTSIWESIISKWKYIRGSKLLFESKDFLSFIKREYINSNIEKIYINREEEKEIIEEYTKKYFKDIHVLNVQDGIKKLSYISNVIEKYLDRKFTGKEGTNIVVDETEAFTSIDVNSACCTKVQNKEYENLKFNLNVIDAISKVINIRNLSGIILIDFIDMDDEASKEKLLDEMYKSFRKNNISCSIHGFTSLGILEISKAKKSKKLIDEVYSDFYKKEINPYYTLKEIENKLAFDYISKGKNNANIYVSSNVLREVDKVDFVENIKNIYSINANICEMKGINGYYIGENSNDNIARINIQGKNIIGKVHDFIQKEDKIQIIIEKIN